MAPQPRAPHAQICDLGLSAMGTWQPDDDGGGANVLSCSQGAALSQESTHSAPPERLLVSRSGSGIHFFPGYGTVTFRAPELKRDPEATDAKTAYATAPISEKCDVWAFGAVCVYALRGDLPNLEPGWKDGDAHACLESCRRAFRGPANEPMLIEGLSSECVEHAMLCDLIESCLGHNPSGRPAASDAIDTLREVFCAVMGGQDYFRPTPKQFELKQTEKLRREMVIARDVKQESAQTIALLERRWEQACRDEAAKKDKEMARQVSLRRAAGRASSTSLWPDRDSDAGEASPLPANLMQPSPVGLDAAAPTASTAPQASMAAAMGPYLGKRTASSSTILRPTGQSVAKFSRMC